MPKLCLVPTDFDGPAFYRCFFPARELAAQHGWEACTPRTEVLVGDGRKVFRIGDGQPFLLEEGKRVLLPNVGDLPAADVLVLQRRFEDHWEATIRGYAGVCVWENDDADLVTPRWHPAYRGLHRGENSFGASIEGMRRVCAACDAVTVSTPFLAESWGTINGNVILLENQLDWGMWDDATLQYDQDRDRFRVGWYGAFKLRTGDLAVLRGVIGPWLERNPNAEFVVAGGQAVEAHDYLGVPAAQRVVVEPTPFSHGDLAAVVSMCDVGLVPLADHEFNDGKSELKGMEFNACGIPVIASPSEPYRRWVDGTNGFLAKTPQHWRDHLDLFANDDELRRRMGRQARVKAQTRTIQEHAHKWDRAYRSLLGERVPEAA